MGILALSNLIICLRWHIMVLPALSWGSSTKHQTLWCKIKPLEWHIIYYWSAGITTASSPLPAMAFDTWRISRHLNKQPSDELFNASLKGRRQKATTGAPAHPAFSLSHLRQ
jgi:hypothetical protein